MASFIGLRACLLAGVAVPSSAAHASEVKELEAVVARQSAMIEALQARVAALETQKGAAASVPVRQVDQTTAATVITASSGKAEQPPAQQNNLLTSRDAGPVGSVSWSNGGPTFVGPGGSTFHVRGRLWLDASTTSGSRYSQRNLAGTEARSFRLGVDGRWGSGLAYKAEVDFGDSVVSIKDLYIAWLGKIGNTDAEIYAGNKLGDRGIDDSSADETMPFQERNEVATGIGPEKGVFGMGLLGKLIGSNWSASFNIVGNDANNYTGTSSNSIAYISRVQWTPSVGQGVFLHIGATGYYEDLSAGARTLNRSAFDTAHFNKSVTIVETPIVGATHTISEQGEAGIVVGPFWAMGEYGRRTIDTLSGVSRKQDAMAVYGGLFLTGEKTNFLGRTGTWLRVQPRRPVTEGGLGAFELLARYETLDLGPSDVAGSGNALTLGTNWYPNSTSRLMLSFVRWHIDNPIGPYIGKDAGNSVNLRLQSAF